MARVARPSHPILVAAAALAVAVGAGTASYGSLSDRRRTRRPRRSTALASSDTGDDRAPGTASESVSAGTPAPSNRELAPANQQQPPADPSPRPSDRSLPPSKVTPPPPDRPRPAAEPTQHAAEATETPENATVDPNISPFRRSHPWAAVPGTPYYYPTRCPATLRFPDLIFFRTQAQARANGYVQAPDSSCG